MRAHCGRRAGSGCVTESTRPAAVRYSALFPAFEADAMTAMIEREPVGEDNVADLILLNYKGADFVGHKYGPDSRRAPRHARRDGPSVGADAECARGKGW